MYVSERGIALIKGFEGFRAKPYLCPAGVPTIGYGTTVYPNGKKVRIGDAPVTESVAVAFLMAHLRQYQDAVNRYAQVNLTQNQYDALVSMTYNVGIGNLQKSTLLKKLNDKDYNAAAQEFDKWVHGNGQRLKGLVNRRAFEKALFLES